MILDTSYSFSPLQHLGEWDRRIQNTHCFELIQSFHQQQIQLVKVLVNQVLLEVFHEEDTWVDIPVKRHVKQVLIQNDDSDAQ